MLITIYIRKQCRQPLLPIYKPFRSFQLCVLVVFSNSNEDLRKRVLVEYGFEKLFFHFVIPDKSSLKMWLRYQPTLFDIGQEITERLRSNCAVC